MKLIDLTRKALEWIAGLWRVTSVNANTPERQPVPEPIAAQPTKQNHRNSDHDEYEHSPRDTHAFNKGQWKIAEIMETLGIYEKFTKAGWESWCMPYPEAVHDLRFFQHEGIAVIGGRGTLREDRVDLTYGLPTSVAALMVNENKRKPNSDDIQSLTIIMLTMQMGPRPGVTAGSGGGWLYAMHSIFLWDKKGSMTDYVTIDEKGEIHPCRYYAGTSFKTSNGTIRRKGWRPPRVMWGDGDHGTVSEVASLAFSAASTLTHHAYLRAKVGRSVLVFPVAIETTKRLFADRTKDGERRRALMHWVKSHQRVNGANVKTHLRGETSFTYRGYQMDVLMPGEHKTKSTPIYTEDGVITGTDWSGVGWSSEAEQLEHVRALLKSHTKATRLSDAPIKHAPVFYQGGRGYIGKVAAEAWKARQHDGQASA